MKEWRFTTIEEIKTASLDEVKTIPKSVFQKSFKDWKKHWHKCIISEGDYFEGDNMEAAGATGSCNPITFITAMTSAMHNYKVYRIPVPPYSL